MSPQGQVALITGPGSSASSETATALAIAGVNLAVQITDHQSFQLAHGLMAAYSHLRITMHTSSTTCLAGVEALFADVFAKHGRIDMVINETGAVLRKPTTQSGDGGVREGLLSYMTFVDLQAREAERQLREETTRRRG